MGANMTSQDIKGELEKDPFVPLRLHLVSGKTIEIPFQSAAWVLQNAVLVFQNPRRGSQSVSGYDVISLRNIERIEQRSSSGGRSHRRAS
jgi:hypothetical protein